MCSIFVRFGNCDGRWGVVVARGGVTIDLCFTCVIWNSRWVGRWWLVEQHLVIEVVHIGTSQPASSISWVAGTVVVGTKNGEGARFINECG